MINLEKSSTKMKPKERVIRAIERKEPDRIPLDGEMDPRVWTQLFNWFETNDQDLIEEKLGIDFKRVTIEPANEYKRLAEPALPGVGNGKANLAIKVDHNLYKDEWGVVKRWHPSSGMYHYEKHPLAEVTDSSAINDYPFPDPVKSERYIEVINGVAKYGENFPVLCETWNFFKSAWELRGFEQFMMDLYLNPELVEALLARLFDYKRIELQNLIKYGIDIFQLSGDIAMQHSMMIDPQIWRRFFKPFYQALIQEFKNVGKVKFMFHSDGYLEPLMEDLIEVGFDIINPIQPESLNVEEIKLKYGDKVCLHGSISIQETMPFGTRNDVRKEVEERIDVLGQGYGFILAPSNTVLPDVPIENILELYNVSRQRGIY